MYEKLDRLRAEVDRLRARVEDDRNRLKAAEERLKNAENAQILADVGALSLSPEQLAQFLQLAASGQLGNGAAMGNITVSDNVSVMSRNVPVMSREDEAQEDDAYANYDKESEENEDED